MRLAPQLLVAVAPLFGACLFDPTPQADEAETDGPATAGSTSDGGGADETAESGETETAEAESGETESGGPPPSGPDAFDPHFRSGSRLLAEVYRDADRPLLLREIWDADLQGPCDMLDATDGQLRCLPRGHGYDQLYSTPDCTGEPVFVAWSSCSAPLSMIRGEPQGMCGDVTHAVYEAVPSDVDAAALYIGGADYCEPAGVRSGLAYTRGAVVEPGAFVAAQRGVETNPDGLGVEVLEGEDGSRFVRQLHDEVWGNCWPRPMDGDGTERCVTNDVAYHESFGWWFGDDGCSATPLAYGYTKECGGTPELVLEVLLGEGAPRYGLSTLGTEITEGNVYSGVDECLASPVAELPWSLFEIGDPLPDDTVPALVRTHDGGAGLRVHWYTAPTGEHLIPVTESPLSDDALGPCYPMPRGDGTYRCVPSSVVGAGGIDYADPACTQPIMAFGSSEVGGVPSWAIGYESGDCADGGEPESIQVWAVGEPYAGPIYYGGDGYCEPSGMAIDVGTYRVVPETPDVFPTLTVERLR